MVQSSQQGENPSPREVTEPSRGLEYQDPARPAFAGIDRPGRTGHKDLGIQGGRLVDMPEDDTLEGVSGDVASGQGKIAGLVAVEITGRRPEIPMRDQNPGPRLFGFEFGLGQGLPHRAALPIRQKHQSRFTLVTRKDFGPGNDPYIN